MNSKYFIVILIFVLTIGIVEVNEVLANEIKIHNQNVYLENSIQGKYYTTRIIDVDEFSTINVYVNSQNISGIGMGIMLYDKFIQWNPSIENALFDLQSMTVSFNRNSNSLSYDTQIKNRYVIIITHDEKILLDQLNIEYSKPSIEQENAIPFEALLTLMGVGGGAGIGIPMQQYYKNQRKNEIKKVLKRDLEKIKTILTTLDKTDETGVHINQNEFNKISYSKSDSLQLEANALLKEDISSAIGSAYDNIKEMATGYAEFVEHNRRFKKDIYTRTVQSIEKALSKL